MNDISLQKLEKMLRAIALGTSIIAILISAAIFFATNSYFEYQLQQIFSGKTQNVNLPVLFVLILAAFAGLFLAMKKEYTSLGAAVSLASVLTIFTWCQFGLSQTMSPYFLGLAAPAVFYLVADKLHLAVTLREVNDHSLINANDPEEASVLALPVAGNDAAKVWESDEALQRVFG